MTEYDYEILIDSIMEAGSNLFSAVCEENLDTMKFLLKKGSMDVHKTDPKGRTVLHLAACRGFLEGVQLLLECHADVNAVDIYGNSPLHWCGNAETIRLLIENGADVMLRNNKGVTPHMIAVRRGVPQKALDVFHSYEAVAPKLSTPDTSIGQPNSTLGQCHSIWLEFCSDLGPYKLLILVLAILIVSLYVALTITGITKHTDSRIAVSSEGIQRIEL